MSINDDLLNYELGEDIDEHALLAVDEDDLLLSDEEIEKEALVIKEEEDIAGQLAKNEIRKEENPRENLTYPSDELVPTSSSSTNQQSQIENKVNIDEEEYTVKDIEKIKPESDVSTSEDSPVKKQVVIKRGEVTKSNKTADVKTKIMEETYNNSKNDEVVTSTNKDAEYDISSEVQINEQTLSDSQIDYSKILSSQESQLTNTGSCDPTEDEEERAERTNIKHTREREENGNSNPESSPEKYSQNNRYQHLKRGSRGGRGGMHFPGGPHGPHPRFSQPYPHVFPQNEQFQHQQYPNYPIENNGPVFRPFHPSNLNGPPSRMDFRSGPNFRPPNPNEFGMFPRGVRPEYVPNSIANGSGYGPIPGPLRPSLFRPEMRPRMQLRPQGPPRMPPNYGNPQMMGSGPRPQQQMNPGPPSNLPPSMQAGNVQASVIPGKILINPNFKGGVEAAKNQLMKDTQFMHSISSHVSHLQSDEELLRQQEEFINKNREHIEKRRYARSRSRSRERSYSPPNRRDRYDRDNKRGGFRGNRGRRGSREWDKFPKRRRSYTPDRKKDNKTNEDEDEETRAYRLEIEKQKAMREKILRDKEMRRRRAAEEKSGVEEKPNDEPPVKLKPIIVTESKIISLKKNKDAETQVNSNNSASSSVLAMKTVANQKSESIAIKRTIPTAKILPEAKRTVADHIAKDSIPVNTSITSSAKIMSTAVVKPVMKKTIIQADTRKDEMFDENEDELLEEDRLLADTPSPPTSPEISPKKPLLTSNRKVVILKSSKNDNSVAASESLSSIDDSKKGIFNRLERKKIGLNETAKRSIRRMFTNNNE